MRYWVESMASGVKRLLNLSSFKNTQRTPHILPPSPRQNPISLGIYSAVSKNKNISLENINISSEIMAAILENVGISLENVGAVLENRSISLEIMAAVLENMGAMMG